MQRARRRAGGVGAGQRHRAAGGMAQPDDRLHQLVLAVAGHAGDAEDLPGADLEGDVAHDVVTAVVADGEVGDAEHRLRRMALAAVDGELHVATDHQLGQVVLVGLARDAAADHLAAADDGDPVGDLQHLVQLVADEDDRVALCLQLAQDAEDLLRLLRRQHRRWLVQHQHPRVAVQGLQDLDPLLPADRQGADRLVRVDLPAEPVAELPDAVLGCRAVQEYPPRHRLLAEQDVLGHRQHRHQHEVLVDHADAAPDGVVRAGDLDCLAVEQDLAGIGHGQAVEDVHEGALAGAVLAEQGVDLPLADLEVDAVVGHDPGVALGDAAHLEHGRFRPARRRRRFSPHICQIEPPESHERTGHEDRSAHVFVATNPFGCWAQVPGSASPA